MGSMTTAKWTTAKGTTASRANCQPGNCQLGRLPTNTTAYLKSYQPENFPCLAKKNCHASFSSLRSYYRFEQNIYGTFRNCMSLLKTDVLFEYLSDIVSSDY